jgi:hypothetical protein
MTSELDVDRSSELLRRTAGRVAPRESTASFTNRPAGFAAVFYPGTVAMSTASAITVDAGEERTGIDFRVELIPTVRVDGAVSRADGQSPSGITVRLVPQFVETPARGQGRAPVFTTAADGAFVFENVVPGEYVLNATDSSNSTAAAESTLVIGSGDVSGVSLVLRRPVDFVGRVIAENTRGNLQPIAGAFVNVIQIGSRSPVTRVTRIDANGQFRTNLPIGRYQVRIIRRAEASSASELAAKSILVNGREVIDAGLDVTGTESVLEAVIAMTDRVGSLGGVIQDAAGAPTGEVTALLFSTDRRAWTWQSRRIKAARPSADGRFSFTDVPPGDYLLAVVWDAEPNEWFIPSFLDGLIAAAIPVSVAEGEKREQNVRLK